MINILKAANKLSIAGKDTKYHPSTIEEAAGITLFNLSPKMVYDIADESMEDFTTDVHFGFGAFIRDVMIHVNKNLKG